MSVVQLMCSGLGLRLEWIYFVTAICWSRRVLYEVYGCSVGELAVARCNALVKVDVVALVIFHILQMYVIR